MTSRPLRGEGLSYSLDDGVGAGHKLSDVIYGCLTNHLVPKTIIQSFLLALKMTKILKMSINEEKKTIFSEDF